MSKPFVLIALIVVMGFLFVQNARAQSSTRLGWYIATFGSNDNDCRTPKTPCADVNTVLALPDISPNDFILAEGANFYYIGEQEIAIYY